MSGDLQGCWYSDGQVQTLTPSGVLVIRGTETFIGCALGRCGTLQFTCVFTSKYTPTFQEIMGRCEHKVVAGSGDLAGVTGFLHFKEDVTTGTATYTGHLKL